MKKAVGIIGLPLYIIIAVLVSSPYAAADQPACSRIIYEGQGAGEVVFDVRSHLASKLTCDDCHESHGLSSALFARKNHASSVTMRKMELGRSCGKCHPVSMNDMSSCSLCHHK